VLREDGLPPLPSGQSLDKTGEKWEVYQYKIEEEQSYGDG
jgi:hypothetical protein